MVGFIEPVGTSFQSAMAERNEQHTIITIAKGLTHSYHVLTNRVFHTSRMVYSVACLCTRTLKAALKPRLYSTTIESAFQRAAPLRPGDHAP
jgi:hypothetical protein